MNTTLTPRELLDTIRNFVHWNKEDILVSASKKMGELEHFFEIDMATHLLALGGRDTAIPPKMLQDLATSYKTARGGVNPPKWLRAFGELEGLGPWAGVEAVLRHQALFVLAMDKQIALLRKKAPVIGEPSVAALKATPDEGIRLGVAFRAETGGMHKTSVCMGHLSKGASLNEALDGIDGLLAEFTDAVIALLTRLASGPVGTEELFRGWLLALPVAERQKVIDNPETMLLAVVRDVASRQAKSQSKGQG